MQNVKRGGAHSLVGGGDAGLHPAG